MKSAWPGKKILVRADRPRPWAVFDEAVVHRIVGGTEVIRVAIRDSKSNATYRTLILLAVLPESVVVVRI